MFHLAFDIYFSLKKKNYIMTTDSGNLCLLSLFYYEKALKCMIDVKHIQGNQNTCLLPRLPLQ